MKPHAFGLAFLLLTVLAPGCADRFQLTPTTRIDGNDTNLSSWQAQRLVDAQKRLARELTTRTGRQWEVSAFAFPPAEAPPNTIFFSKNSKLTASAFRIQVTPESVVVEAARAQNSDRAVDALLDALAQENGRFFLLVGQHRSTPQG